MTTASEHVATYPQVGATLHNIDRPTQHNQERRARVMDIVSSRQMEDGTHEITIAANNVARDNFDLDLASLRLENYLRNPVVLWAHDRRMPPIGRTKGIERVDGRLRARFEFVPDDSFAQRVRNAWEKGFIRAASISWGGGELSFLDSGMIRETNAELYEWSLVPVPADPDALRMAERALGMPEGTLSPMPDTPDIAALLERIERLERAMAAQEPAQSGGQKEGTQDEGPSELEGLEEFSRDLGAFVATLKERK